MIPPVDSDESGEALVDPSRRRATRAISTSWFTRSKNFSDASYGFRPGGARASGGPASPPTHRGGQSGGGRDLEKFFDRVNHDVLMARVARR